MPCLTKRHRQNQNGFVLVISTIIIAAVISIILIKTMFSAMTQNMTSSTTLSGALTETLSESCAQEALIRLNRDNAYGGGPIALDSDQCTITVAGAGNNRTITVTAQKNGYYRMLTITVTLSPFAIIAWDN